MAKEKKSPWRQVLCDPPTIGDRVIVGYLADTSTDFGTLTKRGDWMNDRDEKIDLPDVWIPIPKLY